MKILCSNQKICRIIFLACTLATKSVYFYAPKTGIPMVRVLHSGFYFDITWLAPFSCLIRLLVSCVFRCHLSPYFLAQNLPAGPANYICATFIAFPKHFFLFHHIRCIFHIAPRILFFTSWEPDCIIRIRDISGSFDPLTSCRPGYIPLPGFLFSQLFWSNFSKQNWIDNLPCCRHKNRIFSVFSPSNPCICIFFLSF